MRTLHNLWTVFRSFPLRRLAIMTSWTAIVVAYYALFRDNIPLANVGRLVGLTAVSIIFGLWTLIMAKSAAAYVEALERGDDDADLREHIWEITLSYLIAMGGTAYRTVGLIGQPMQVDALVVLLLACPLGIHALYIFAKPAASKRVKPAGRTTTITNEST